MYVYLSPRTAAWLREKEEERNRRFYFEDARRNCVRLASGEYHVMNPLSKLLETLMKLLNCTKINFVEKQKNISAIFRTKNFRGSIPDNATKFRSYASVRCHFLHMIASIQCNERILRNCFTSRHVNSNNQLINITWRSFVSRLIKLSRKSPNWMRWNDGLTGVDPTLRNFFGHVQTYSFLI